MPARVTWTNLAREDVLDIYVTIALDNEQAVDRIYRDIEEKVMGLADHPRMGPLCPELGKSLRRLVAPPYLIFYEIESGPEGEMDSEVRVLRVLHGRRDLKEIF
ncbi:MAG: type II toxin-antitoxin system RelE/ParE family toxin [Hyphomicrobiales bacterium]